MEDFIGSDTFVVLLKAGCTISMLGSYVRVDRGELSFFVHERNISGLHVKSISSTTNLMHKSEFVVNRRSNEIVKSRHLILDLVEHYCIAQGIV